MRKTVTKDPVIAILCSDLHFSASPPIARSVEPDWYLTQQGYIIELNQLRLEHNAPIVCAGDVFDHWKATPELVNFLLDDLPAMFAIPGQHDLPYHAVDDVKQSAYWTLVKAGKITNIEHGKPIAISDRLWLHGFPWGSEVTPLVTRKAGSGKARLDCLHLAVIHAYIWNSKENSYQGADKLSRAKTWLRKLEGYDAAIFGDNHKGFFATDQDSPLQVLNCGGFMRRNIDQVDYRPGVGLLHASGLVSRHLLDVSQDKFIDVAEALKLVEQTMEMGDLIASLAKIADNGINFVKRLQKFIKANDIDDRVSKIILEATDKQGAKSWTSRNTQD